MQNFKQLLRLNQSVITVSDAEKLFGKNRQAAAKDLARFAMQGKLLRIRRGSYITVSPELMDKEDAFDDPWIASSSIFPSSYIGGWSALEHHGLTEQIFKDTCIISTVSSASHQGILHFDYIYKKIPALEFFGLETVWRKQAKVNVSNIHKTIIDILNYPELGGEIRHIISTFTNYLNSPDKNLDMLIEYAFKINQGTMLKRLGFLLDNLLGSGNKFSNKILKNINTTGYSNLDFRIPCKKSIATWKLYIPSDLLLTSTPP